MERNLPGVFSAAGLMVPDPSIMLPPIPFMVVDGGIDVEYMAGRWNVCVGEVVRPRLVSLAAARVLARKLRWRGTNARLDGDDDDDDRRRGLVQS